MTDARGLVERARAEAASQGGEVLLLDADRVAGPEHLLVAAERAERARQEGRGAADSLPMETLLYAAAERQIATAQAKMAVRPGSVRLALVAWRCDPDDVLGLLGLRRDDRVLAPTLEKVRAFGITATELATVRDDQSAELVLERIALLEVAR